MKTLFKILRSVITSLLFIIITVAWSVQFIFIFAKTTGENISDIIDREKLLDVLLAEKIEDESSRNILIDYIDSQINYIFYARSYPSTQNVDYSSLEETKKETVRLKVEELKEKMDIDYKTILRIRNIDAHITNGAIFFLVNIAIFVLFLIGSILKKSFKSSLKLSSISLTVTGILMLIIGTYVNSNISNILEEKLIPFISVIIDNEIIERYTELSLIYICTGLLIIFITTYINKILRKDYKLSTKF